MDPEEQQVATPLHRSFPELLTTIEDRVQTLSMTIEHLQIEQVTLKNNVLKLVSNAHNCFIDVFGAIPPPAKNEDKHGNFGGETECISLCSVC